MEGEEDEDGPCITRGRDDDVKNDDDYPLQVSSSTMEHTEKRGVSKRMD